MSNTFEIRAPDDQTEGTRSQILRWLKAVGDAVAEHEPLIELETDKVTVEVASPAAGILQEIVKREQEEVAPGEVVGRIEIASRGSAATPAPTEPVVGTSANGELQSTPPATQPNRSIHVDAQSPGRATKPLSPAVRRLLAERGLKASDIHGTGENGRITVDDVLAYAAHHAATPARPTSPTGSTVPSRRSNDDAQATAPTASTAPARTIPHSAVRKRIAAHMVHSLLQTAPHVTTVFEADLSAVQSHRAAHRADFDSKGAPLTLTAYFVAATVNAIRAVPEANSRWTDTALELFDDIHIGIATAIEGTGLVVPVLKHVETLDLLGIATGLNRLVTAARDGHLDPADVRGGTFTVSNHGVSGSLLATPIVINQPQSAILGIGKVEKRPVVVEHGEAEPGSGANARLAQIVIRPKCYVTLTIDHRVMDGHQANRFLQVFVRTLESWPAT